MILVAYGACVQAAVLQRKQNAPSMYVRNVTPLTVGVIGSEKDFPCYPLIRRNSAYPIEKFIGGRTTVNDQRKVRIILYEGEHRSVNGNTILGDMILGGITPAPIGREKIKVGIKIDEKGIISATAIDKTTGNQKTLVIEKRSQFTEDEIGRLTEAVQELPLVIPSAPDSASDADFVLTISHKRKKIEGEENDEIENCPIYGYSRDEHEERETVDLINE